MGKAFYPISVLIVEDDESCFLLTKRFLERCLGDKVTVLPNGIITSRDKAIEWIKAVQPNLIILDNNFSPLKDDGVFIAHWVSDNYPEIKIIMNTGDSETDLRDIMPACVCYFANKEHKQIAYGINEIFSLNTGKQQSVV